MGSELSVTSRVLTKLRDPAWIEAWLRTKLAGRLGAHQDQTEELARLLEFCRSRFDDSGSALVDELHRSAFFERYQQGRGELGSDYLDAMGTTCDFDCQTLYIVVRLLQPKVVVETGVMFGGFSAHILAALEANGSGELHSIDLPKPEEIGALIPAELRHRWHLYEGDVREVLPDLLERVAPVDLFHHDSVHQYAHQLWEYRTAQPRLSDRGVLTSHDVVHVPGFRDAFRTHCRANSLRFGVFSSVGVAWR